MRIKVLSAVVGACAIFACGTANAATTNGLNTSFVSGAEAIGGGPASVWFFNWTARSSVDHHVPDGFTPKTATDYKAPNANTQPGTLAEGTLSYDNPVFSDDSTAPVHLDVRGYTDTDGSLTPDTDSQEKVLQDYAGGATQNGLGIMSPAENYNSSKEQVNSGPSEYLHLVFDQNVTIFGFDFAAGNHQKCGQNNNNCIGFELFKLTADDGFVLAAADILADTDPTAGNNGKDFSLFEAQTAREFIIRAVDPGNTFGSGERGWYLSGVAGNLEAVPLPASVFFMLAGIAGLGALRMRRKA